MAGAAAGHIGSAGHTAGGSGRWTRLEMGIVFEKFRELCVHLFKTSDYFVSFYGDFT